jgi:DNA segregation ATPase FtsK/SpoIIIE-like protein
MTKASTSPGRKKLKNPDLIALPAPEYVFVDPEVIKAGKGRADSSGSSGGKKNIALYKNSRNKTAQNIPGYQNNSKKDSFFGIKSDQASSKKSHKLPDKLVMEIQGIVLVSLSLMLLTGLAIDSESLLCAFSNLLTRLAGYGAYLFSLLFWLWGFERFRGRTFFRGIMDYAAWGITFVTIIFFSQAVSETGGSLGETLWPIVNRIAGPAGATVLLTAMTIISFLLVAEVLFSDFMMKTAKFMRWLYYKTKAALFWSARKIRQYAQKVYILLCSIFNSLVSLYKDTFATKTVTHSKSVAHIDSEIDFEKSDDLKCGSAKETLDSDKEFPDSDKETFDSDYENDFDEDFDDFSSIKDSADPGRQFSDYDDRDSFFAGKEIILEADSNEKEGYEYVSRIDAILGNSTDSVRPEQKVKPEQEDDKQDKPFGKKGFFSGSLKKMASLIPGKSRLQDNELQDKEQNNQDKEQNKRQVYGENDFEAASFEDLENDSFDDFEAASFEDRAVNSRSETASRPETALRPETASRSETGARSVISAGLKTPSSQDISANTAGTSSLAGTSNTTGTSSLASTSNSAGTPSLANMDEDDFYDPLIYDDEEDEEDEIYFQLPPITLLDEVKITDTTVLEAELRERGEIIISTLMEFKIKARILEIVCGPSVTQFQIQIAKGVKVSKVLGLQENIGMNLAIHSVRIEAPIPGKSAIGVEIPNSVRTPVHFREIVENMLIKNKKDFLNMGFGKDIAGRYVCADLSKMPHLLVAGATGSGKSVCMNTIICSILFESTPKDVKFIMVDPKMVEMTVYKDIPHLLVPPIVDAKEAAAALHWCVEEMERRYEILSFFGVRNLESYNDFVESGEIKEKARRLDPEDYAKLGSFKKMPLIVVVIDELADLMLVASKDVETSISRIAAKARAIGIHLVIATQRPSVNVITGVIKANLPSRIAFAVSSVVDSKTILDRKGAELLLGRGDMLFSPVGQRKPTRLQGAFISDEEVERLCDFLREQSKPDYNPEITRIADDSSDSDEDLSDIDNYLGRDKELVMQAARHVIETNFASASGLQRHLRIGYARAGRVIDLLEKLNIITGKDSKNNRKILMTSDEVEEIFS